MFRRLNSCAVPGYAPLCMDTNDPDTVECAFKQRLLRDVPPSNKGFLQRFRSFVRQYLASKVQRARHIEFEEWLEGTSYNEQRKDQLRAAHDSLRGGRPTHHQASQLILL